MLHFAINKYLSQFVNFNFRIQLNNILIFEVVYNLSNRKKIYLRKNAELN